VSRPALIVIAKAPVPGRAKTRLSPPCTPAQAARLARAALEDTLAACGDAAGVRRRVLALDGEPGGWLPRGWDVVAQRGAGLAERLRHAFADVGGPALLLGMDTPQATPRLLGAGLAALGRSEAVFGPATDGGYWAIGLREPDDAVFDGVAMSRDSTGAVQLGRLRALGLRTAILPSLTDVDDISDARAVAREAPTGRFAAALATIEPELEAA
jgi:rSAM/selenodomain-associated transferase 1